MTDFLDSDEDLARELRARADLAVPAMSLDHATLVRAGRRRRALRTAGAAVTTVAGAAAVFVGVSVAGFQSDPSLQVASTPSPTSEEEWVWPAWMTEQEQLRSEIRTQLQSCIDARGWDLTVTEHGGAVEPFTDEGELERYGEDRDACFQQMGVPTEVTITEEIIRANYAKDVDTWQCLQHYGYDTPAPPSEEEYVEAGLPTLTGQMAGYAYGWTPYGTIVGDDDLVDWQERCPQRWGWW